MSILSHDSFWNAVITMPMTKKMLQMSLKKCGKCGRTVLEAALDDYTGKTDVKCDRCSGLYSQVIGFWVEFLRRGLGFKRAKVENLLTDPYARRAVLNLTKSFAYLGIKKPMSLYSPFLVVWDFTHKCNLSCKHCYSDSGAVKEEELSTSQALAVVDQLADAGVTALAFSGGEPLTRKDFFEVARHAAYRGLYVSVASNGTLLTKENVQKLKQAKLTTLTSASTEPPPKPTTTSEASQERSIKRLQASKTVLKPTYASASPQLLAKTTWQNCLPS